MRSPAKLFTFSKLNHTNSISVFFPEKRHRTSIHRLLHSDISMLLKSYFLVDSVIYSFFYFADFLIGHFLEMRKVKSQRLRIYTRTSLLHMRPQNLSKRLMQQVRS